MPGRGLQHEAGDAPAATKQGDPRSVVPRRLGVLGLFLLVAVLGPEIAPHNPFLQDRIQAIDWQLHRAPIYPCDLYRLGTDDKGRDLLSMLLYGARRMLALASAAMIIRLLTGLLLGTISGWWQGSLVDRGVQWVAEFLAAIAGLILGMLIVFGVGIRQGQVAFVVALATAGWGEVTQVIRSHVLTIRQKLYILAARTVGLNGPQTLRRHVLPGLLPAVIVLSALEMAGALLLGSWTLSTSSSAVGASTSMRPLA